MARLTRAVQKIFGSTAGASDIAQIGSLRNGEIVYTTDPVTLQGLSLYLTGLKGIVSSDKYIPALEDINGIYFLFSRQLAYLMQEGIAEWDASTEYHIGSKVKAPGTGNVYTSLTNNNTGNEVTDAGHWTDAIITDIMSEKTPGAGVTIDDLNIKDNGINGSTIIKNDLQLTGSTADGFPNTTTTYIWNIDSASSENQTDVVGGKVLTVVAGELESATDVLGNTKFCKWSDGDTYLQSTDEAFNVANTADTDDFMVGGWVYIPDTTPATTETLFSNQGAANNGWRIEWTSTNLLYFTFDLATDVYFSMQAPTTAGWHHIVFAREVGVGVKGYINGILSGSGADATIGTTQSKFQLGGFNGTTGLPEDGTCYDEVFFRKGVLPTNLDDVVRNIYARSAKKFAVKAQDGTVTSILPHTDEPHLQSVIDVVQIGNTGIADNDTDILKFNFTPKKIVLNFSGIVYKDAINQGHGTGSCVITITGTNTFTSVLNRSSSFLADGTFSTDTATGDTTNVIYIKAGGTYFVGTAVWNTAAKTLTITYQEANTTTASNGIDITAVAYK